jgi:heat shock protein HslJ
MTTRLAASLLALALIACSAPTPNGNAGAPDPANVVAAPVPTSTLTAYHWDLVGATDGKQQPIGALLPNPDKPLRLGFADGAVQVRNGCNHIGGRYRLDGAALKVDALAQTEMACEDRRLMDADAAIAARLEAAPTLQLDTGKPPKLTLRTDAGDVLTFNGVATSETRYGGPGTRMFFEVAAQRKPCSHPLIPDMQCLQVRERTYDAQGLVVGTPGEWQPLYQEIEGFEHLPGQRNVVRVKRYEIKNAPADAPAVAYVLDMVVESEIAPAGN